MFILNSAFSPHARTKNTKNKTISQPLTISLHKGEEGGAGLGKSSVLVTREEKTEKEKKTRKKQAKQQTTIVI